MASYFFTWHTGRRGHLWRQIWGQEDRDPKMGELCNFMFIRLGDEIWEAVFRAS